MGAPGRYRIHTVAEVTGIASATLRAWERRYGVPTPTRSAAAYRLYSDHDVDLIKKMRDNLASGVAAAEAARLVLAGEDQPQLTVPEADPFVASRDRIIDAVVRFHPEGLEEEVRRALTLGAAMHIFDRTLGPAMRAIGDLWHQGKVSVAQEHLASQVVGAAMADMLRFAQPTEAERRAVLACFADEDHGLGLYGVALRFASWGLRVVNLGARTPPSAVGSVVQALAPDLVGLSCSVAPEPARARELIDAYADACRTTAWIVGGPGAAGMERLIEARGGIYVDRDLSEARAEIERAIASRHRARKRSP